MRILSVVPPQVPSYFNAGHHLMTFEIAAYLRKAIPRSEVYCVDGAALNCHWRRMAEVLYRGFDLIAVMVDYDGIDPLARFLRYARALSPQARLLVFGRLTYQIPEFFERYDAIDAVVDSGDPEAAVACYARFLQSGSGDLSGLRWRMNGSFRLSPPGRWLPAEEWELPDVSEIPYDAYDRMYERDLDKFCGIPERRELVIPVARGCPVGCVYCDVPQREGKLGRWLSIDRVIDYVRRAFRACPFEYISFYAPTFTLHRAWVEQLCTAMRAEPRRYPWKCTTTLFHLDEQLIRTMATSGCVRISVGLESLATSDASILPHIKRNISAKFESIADACRDTNVELNCFVILGLPGESPEDVAQTINRVLAKGARVRPTIYTPYQELSPGLNEVTLGEYNRQLFIEGAVDAGTARLYYDLCYANKNDRPTEVMQGIAPARLMRS